RARRCTCPTAGRPPSSRSATTSKVKRAACGPPSSSSADLHLPLEIPSPCEPEGPQGLGGGISHADLRQSSGDGIVYQRSLRLPSARSASVWPPPASCASLMSCSSTASPA